MTIHVAIIFYMIINFITYIVITAIYVYHIPIAMIPFCFFTINYIPGKECLSIYIVYTK